MVQHLRDEVTALLVIAGVLVLLGRECVFPCHHWLLSRGRCASRLAHHAFLLPHGLHLLVIERIPVLQSQLGVLLDLIRVLFRFQTDDIELAILFVVDFSLVESQAIVPIARKMGLR